MLLGFSFLVIAAIWLLIHQWLNNKQGRFSSTNRITSIIHISLIIAGLYFFLSGYYNHQPLECPGWKQKPVIECTKHPTKCWIKFEIK